MALTAEQRNYFLKLRESMDNAITAVLTDDTKLLSVKDLAREWASNKIYSTGDVCKYQDTLYRVLQGHTSQDSWTPDVSPSLFAKILIPDDSVIPEWEQPGSTNPYMTGDKVTHNGITWESLVDNNVWEPGATGTDSLWTQVTK